MIAARFATCRAVLTRTYQITKTYDCKSSKCQGNLLSRLLHGFMILHDDIWNALITYLGGIEKALMHRAPSDIRVTVIHGLCQLRRLLSL